MNERIKELWNRAAESTAAYPSGQNTSWETQVNFMNKFAQLIVAECADICIEMAAKCAGLEGDGALAKDCAYWIKKDFGVE
jgi:uncharacterized protein YutE (UPF0331/DUF86 family)